jgi:hypothetical protein
VAVYGKIPFLFLSLSLIFFSCSTLRSADTARTQSESFTAVEAVLPQWQSLTNGVDFFHGKITVPQLAVSNMEFWALKIDLLAPNLQIVVKGGTLDGAADAGTLSVKVSSFVSANGLTAGINATPFDISTAKEGQPIKNVGIIISDGKLIAPANSRYDALVFYADGKTAIVNQSSIKSTENIVNAVGGFHHILINGEPAERTIGRENRDPRSAAGISANGQYLYLLVIDGRRMESAGGTEKETALLMLALGAWNGINFDGGGSTALALRGEDGKVRVVNTPVHGGIHGRERAVAGCLGIAVNPSTER